MVDDVKKEHIKGRYGIIQTLITAVATIVAAVIGLYAVTLQNANTTLQEQNIELQERNEALRTETQNNSKAQDTIASLERRISALEAENLALRDKNSAIQNNYETVQSNYEAALAEIDRLNQAVANNASPNSGVIDKTFSGETVEMKALSIIYSRDFRQEKTAEGELLNSYRFDAGANSYAEFYLNGDYNNFVAEIVTSPHTGNAANMTVDIKLDYTSVFHQENIKKNGNPIPVSIDLSGAQRMTIQTSYIGNGAYGYLYFINTAITK